jgi:hypothetical protein
MSRKSRNLNTHKSCLQWSIWDQADGDLSRANSTLIFIMNSGEVELPVVQNLLAHTVRLMVSFAIISQPLTFNISASF